MTIADVNKLIALAERATKALEKIAKESERQNNLLGGDLGRYLENSVATTPDENVSHLDFEKGSQQTAPPLDWHSGRNR